MYCRARGLAAGFGRVVAPRPTESPARRPLSARASRRPPGLFGRAGWLAAGSMGRRRGRPASAGGASPAGAGASSWPSNRALAMFIQAFKRSVVAFFGAGAEAGPPDGRDFPIAGQLSAPMRTFASDGSGASAVGAGLEAGAGSGEALTLRRGPFPSVSGRPAPGPAGREAGRKGAAAARLGRESVGPAPGPPAPPLHRSHTSTPAATTASPAANAAGRRSGQQIASTSRTQPSNRESGLAEGLSASAGRCGRTGSARGCETSSLGNGRCGSERSSAGAASESAVIPRRSVP